MPNKNFIRVVACILITLFLSCQSGNSQTGLGPDEVKQKMEQQPGAVILDVRTPEEYEEGHLQGAVLLNFDDSLENKIDSLDSTKTYIVYCHSGGRSHSATVMMQKKGFKNVYDLKGGIVAWEKKGYPVVRD